MAIGNLGAYTHSGAGSVSTVGDPGEGGETLQNLELIQGLSNLRFSPNFSNYVLGWVIIRVGRSAGSQAGLYN